MGKKTLSQSPETNHLILNCSKANKYLNWKPKISLELALNMILDWQNAFETKDDMKKFSLKQISDFNRM